MEATRQFLDKPALRAMRRRDRAQDDDWIGRFLGAAPGGILAVADRGGPPVLNANLFAYDPRRHEIVIHTTSSGYLAEVLAGPRPASFSVFEYGRMVAADRAFDYSCEYASVVATGTVSRETDPGLATTALQLLMDKYAPQHRPGVDYEPATHADLKLTAVYRMRIESWSGKRKELPADEPRAYEFPYKPEFPCNRRTGRWRSAIARAMGGEMAVLTK